MRARVLALLLGLMLPLAAAPGAAQGADAQADAGQAAAPVSLAAAWQLAKANDPSYQAAISERQAGQANRALGRAALLPQISASAGRSRTRGTLQAPDARGDVADVDLAYMTRTNQIQASQVLFDWTKIANARQGYARADFSLAVFDTKARDTATRLVNRYLQALLSYENVALSRGDLDTSDKNIDIAQRRYQAGEGTITDVREATSRRDLSRANLIQAEDSLAIARRELQAMIGADPATVLGLSPDFHPLPPDPLDLAVWQARAEQANADIRSSQQNLRVAEREVDKAIGGFLPTVSGVAARSVNQSDSVSTRDQYSYYNSIGVQANVSIFSGGQTIAQVRQARHGRDQAGHQLAAAQAQVGVDVTRQYQGVVSGAQRIAALETAVRTGAQSLEAMQKSYQGGTRSISDILDAQDQLFTARRDLAQARLEYVNARIGLDAVTGALDDEAIARATATWFGPDVVQLD
ncbi:TolC family outer membrane protein [Castellaniella hirudinis]|uniref:TolC family outer membrane protein n=1 Tax=Castellaniella hirudinis TaxID=1144617 RepID=UPI0039C4297D